ncbi:MocR-like pyridoxine biosynthesis transcription factor PdxR [Derxia lacustris]|uniref:MocR-like pyridoxine biosynthesis transcription factor PdxR n=1 Tax=Derxia lacustris TaxID=764842 RepID=UPI000A1763F3|nr:PLP-dependent aminotransferase family protein [Derxia lacustris]
MRQAPDIELGVAPRPAGVTRQRWLYDELRGAILAGRLRPGQRLPPSRDFARQQGVSRGTVLAVYAQLAAEGYLTGAVGSGTVVSGRLPEGAAVAPASVLARAEVVAAPPPVAAAARLSQRGVRLAATPFPVDESVGPLRCFRANQPDFSAFPLAVWNRIAAQRASALRPARMAYGDAAGHLPLRQAIAAHLRTAQRIDCDARQVMIVGSAQQALDLASRLLLDEGDAVWMEDPGYPGAARLFEANGARVVPVPVDADGLRVDAGTRLAPEARLAYVTAAHQSPLGMALALDRRLALLRWAAGCGATVIEDDYDSEFRHAGTPLAALKSLDGGGRVIYLGSFSKLLFPSLRLAYVVLPDWLVEPFAAALSLGCRQVAPQAQALLAEFIAEGHFARHVRRMRLLYSERAAALQAAVTAQLGGWLDLLPITTGLDAAGLLTAGSDDCAVVARLAAAGVEARPLSFYALGAAGAPGLVLGFSAFGVDEIRAGVAAMARALPG